MNFLITNQGQQKPPGLVKTVSNSSQKYDFTTSSQSENTSLQNIELLNKFLSDPAIFQLLNDIINHKNGYNISAPILSLQIMSLKGEILDLNEEGINSVFSMYGKVVKIIARPPGKAFVVFQEISQALFAQKSLNNKYLSDNQANISVEWITQQEYESLFKITSEEQKKLLVKEKKNIFEKKIEENSDSTNGSKFQTSVPVKYTCRYEIQIENEREFQVARKIIGSKGCNMKKIIDLCLKENNIDCPKSEANDIVKLRLRGKGSGYKEGNIQEESRDPLHLCVSSKFKETFATACKYVEELLTQIYEEFNSFLKRNGYPEREMSVKKLEVSPVNSNANSFLNQSGSFFGSFYNNGSFFNNNSNPGSFLNMNGKNGNNFLIGNNEKEISFIDKNQARINEISQRIYEEQIRNNFQSLNLNEDEKKEMNEKKINLSDEKKEKKTKLVLKDTVAPFYPSNSN